MTFEDIGKYAAIGLSVFSLYEVAIALLKQVDDATNRYIDKRILQDLQTKYEILCSLGT